MDSSQTFNHILSEQPSKLLVGQRVLCKSPIDTDITDIYTVCNIYKNCDYFESEVYKFGWKTTKIPYSNIIHIVHNGVNYENNQQIKIGDVRQANKMIELIYRVDKSSTPIKVGDLWHQDPNHPL
jgi:hypothetical protein